MTALAGGQGCLVALMGDRQLIDFRLKLLDLLAKIDVGGAGALASGEHRA
jgi:hypothetical protein